jgi:hypothetical protein
MLANKACGGSGDRLWLAPSLLPRRFSRLRLLDDLNLLAISLQWPSFELNEILNAWQDAPRWRLLPHNRIAAVQVVARTLCLMPLSAERPSVAIQWQLACRRSGPTCLRHCNMLLAVLSVAVSINCCRLRRDGSSKYGDDPHFSARKASSPARSVSTSCPVGLSAAATTTEFRSGRGPTDHGHPPSK